jgi:hypothetical protein
MKQSNVIILAVLVALVAGGGGFALGHMTAAKASSTTAAAGGSSGRYGQAGGFRRGGFGTRGTVSAVSGNTITVTTTTGSTATVDVTSSTTYTNSDGSVASLTDVTTGTTIMAIGQTTSGVVNATRILINPPAPGSYSGGGSNSGSAPSN